MRVCPAGCAVTHDFTMFWCRRLHAELTQFYCARLATPIKREYMTCHGSTRVRSTAARIALVHGGWQCSSLEVPCVVHHLDATVLLGPTWSHSLLLSPHRSTKYGSCLIYVAAGACFHGQLVLTRTEWVTDKKQKMFRFSYIRELPSSRLNADCCRSCKASVLFLVAEAVVCGGSQPQIGHSSCCRQGERWGV